MNTGQRLFLIVMGVVVVGFGVLAVARPDLSFRLSMVGRRWEFRDRDVQPSDLRLSLSRIGGGASIPIGLALIVWRAVG